MPPTGTVGRSFLILALLACEPLTAPTDAGADTSDAGDECAPCPAGMVCGFTVTWYECPCFESDPFADPQQCRNWCASQLAARGLGDSPYGESCVRGCDELKTAWFACIEANRAVLVCDGCFPPDGTGRKQPCDCR